MLSIWDLSKKCILLLWRINDDCIWSLEETINGNRASKHAYTHKHIFPCFKKSNVVQLENLCNQKIPFKVYLWSWKQGKHMTFLKLKNSFADFPNQGTLFLQTKFIVTKFILFMLVQCIPGINFRLKSNRNKKVMTLNCAVSKGF